MFFCQFLSLWFSCFTFLLLPGIRLHPHFTRHKTELQEHPNGKINLAFSAVLLVELGEHIAMTVEREKTIPNVVKVVLWVWVIDSMIRLAIAFIKVIVIVITPFITDPPPHRLHSALLCFEVDKNESVCVHHKNKSMTITISPLLKEIVTKWRENIIFNALCSLIV